MGGEGAELCAGERCPLSRSAMARARERRWSAGACGHFLRSDESVRVQGAKKREAASARAGERQCSAHRSRFDLIVPSAASRQTLEVHRLDGEAFSPLHVRPFAILGRLRSGPFPRRPGTHPCRSSSHHHPIPLERPR